KTGSAQIVDAFVSENSSGTPQTRSGHGDMPSVKCLGWTNVIDWRKATFKSAADLNWIFRSAGIDPAQPIVVYGDTLVQAATLACALESAGARNVKICFRGWDR